MNLSPLQFFLDRINVRPHIRDRRDDREGNGSGNDGDWVGHAIALVVRGGHVSSAIFSNGSVCPAQECVESSRK